MGERVLSGVLGTQIDRVMELARHHLDMEVALLSEFTEGRQVFRAVEGDAKTFGLAVGGGAALESTYCHRLVNGEIPNAIPDTAADGRVRDLPVTQARSIGSYVAVPLTLSDGTVYGTFCCLSHDRKSLNSRDVHFMAMLGELVVDELDAKRQQEEQRAGIVNLIDGSRLQMALQPVVSLETGACLGMEALSRFPAGFGAPDIVFATAERVGLASDLERLAVQHAVELLPKLAPEQFLAVNLSPAVARDLTLEVTPDTQQVLQRLVVEITEHAAVAEYAELRERLQPYREQGLRLAIDDAGAGYASLHHIVELEPDIIKIDRSLINGVATDRGRRSVVSALVLLALDLRATVVAEGIETPDDFFASCDLGVDAAQGFLLARPTTNRRTLARWTRKTITLPERQTVSVELPVRRIGSPAKHSAARSGGTTVLDIPTEPAQDRVSVNF